MATPKITFYVDIISPFAFLAFQILKSSPAFQACAITYTPILLGGVMQATGNQPPLNIKNKDSWINTERIRWAKYFNIPIAQTSPQPFPQSTVNTQRALCAIFLSQPAKLEAAIDALWKAFWVERQSPIGDLKVMAAALEPVLGEAGTKEILGKIKDEEVKNLLKSNTEKAVKEGSFGLPWFVCTNAKGEQEAFFGVDHIGQVIDFLGLEKPTSGGFRALLISLKHIWVQCTDAELYPFSFGGVYEKPKAVSRRKEPGRGLAGLENHADDLPTDLRNFPRQGKLVPAAELNRSTRNTRSRTSYRSSHHSTMSPILRTRLLKLFTFRSSVLRSPVRYNSTQQQPRVPEPEQPRASNPHREFYKGSGRTVVFNFLVAMATFQAVYWSWLKLESMEVKKEKEEEVRALEGELRGLVGSERTGKK